MVSLKTKSSQEDASEGTSLLGRSAEGTSPNATRFFLLTFVLASPLYLLSVLAGMNILGTPELAGLYIGLVTLTPILSASILTRQAGGRLNELYSRCLRFHRGKHAWYAIAVLLGPLIAVISYGIVKVLLKKHGEDLPEIPPPMVPFNFLTVPAVLFFMFILATFEEVGWMGYAFDTMQSKMGAALPASLMLGVIWAAWHWPFFLVLFPEPKYITVGCQVLILIANRVLECWIYNNTNGSVLAVILHHAIDNVAFTLLPDVRAYAPMGPIALCLVTVAAAGIVMILWDGQTLTRSRFERREHR